MFCLFFFFNDTATTEIYTLSLHDALPICCILVASATFWEGVDLPGDALQLVVIDKLPFPPPDDPLVEARSRSLESVGRQDRKSTRLNSSHSQISYAVFCLKKKTTTRDHAS